MEFLFVFYLINLATAGLIAYHVIDAKIENIRLRKREHLIFRMFSDMSTDEQKTFQSLLKHIINNGADLQSIKHKLNKIKDEMDSDKEKTEENDD